MMAFPRARTVAALVRARRFLTPDGYLQKTAIPTFKFQDSLPKLKIPDLEKTIQKYIASATPLVSSEQLEETKKIATAFLNQDGKILQERVVAEDKKKYSSYICEPWFDMYLRFRDPLPINMNPQLTMKDDPDPKKHSQVARAASIVSASVAFYRTLRDGHLAPDVYHTKPQRSKTPLFERLVRAAPSPLAWPIGFAFGAYALDMSQYGNLFKSTRVPQPGKDQLVTFEEQQSRHIIIQRGHDFYKLNVLRQDGTAVPEAEIAAALAEIASGPASTTAPPLGAATTMARDTWANLRNKIMSASQRNMENVSDIDSALFALCLEDTSPGAAPMTPLGSVANEEYVELSECMLYGNGRNRWFDKSFQLIIAENGKTAVNFEHAWGDGVAVLRYFEEVYKESTATPIAEPRAGEHPVKLEFDFDAAVSQELHAAAAAFDEFRDDIDMRVLQTQAMDTNRLKALRLGTDGTMQMSFQLAHYRMFGHNAPTYESASTAGFKHGRTETIRSCTIESDKFVHSFCDPSATQKEREEAMRIAIKNHAKIAKDALLGGGWDRHLFALKAMAEKMDMPLPELYTDPTYATLAHIILSTSTLSSPALEGGGFGPVNRDCFGIGYGIIDLGAQLAVTTYHRGTQEMLDHIEQAMKDMIAVAEGDNF